MSLHAWKAQVENGIETNRGENLVQSYDGTRNYSTLIYSRSVFVSRIIDIEFYRVCSAMKFSSGNEHRNRTPIDVTGVSKVQPCPILIYSHPLFLSSIKQSRKERIE